MKDIHLAPDEFDFALWKRHVQLPAARTKHGVKTVTIVESGIRPNEMMVDGGGIEAFRHRLSGALVCPRDQGYDAARAVWNGMIDRRPALIAYCTNRQDVIEAVNFARRTGILTAVRSGGHNIAGASLCDGGLVIDLSRMNRVTVDSVSRTARAEGGAQLADLDTATQAHGLATTTRREQRHRTDRANAWAEVSVGSAASTGLPATTCYRPRWSRPMGEF